MNYEKRTFEFPEINGLSKDQLALHIDLYEGYVKHVNILMTQMNVLAKSGDEFAYSIAELRRRLGFEWNGMRLHELYFEALEHGAKVLLADTKLFEALAKQYGSFSNWLEIFSKLSARGPGWALLNYDSVTKHFHHTWVADHEVGHLASLPVILAVDHWEHAYLVDYLPKDKGMYVQSYLNALDWETVSARFDKAVS
ncbi:MAG: Superoxide dismutase (Fe) [Parcubacteria group bacterium GW2011_GWD2_42_14]|nr:MAG: Superoxide dismutase (Fe) [Parcubacteria group bacterium GW2011_GWD2_42_14]